MLKILDTGDKVYQYNKSVIVKFVGKRGVLSTGIINGGYSENITAIFNNDAKTAPGMGCQLKAPTYKEHMEIIAQELGLDPKYTTGLGTAADMKNMSITVEKYEDLSVTALITGGIETNGGRVGDPASYIENNGKIEQVKHGTINIMVAINGNLLPHTLTRALITITEAKTAAIQELLEGSKYSSGIATGSGTDGVIVYCNLESERTYKDAGKHSKLGELIGKAVKKVVKEALGKQSDLTPQRQKSIFRRGRRYGITAEKVWEKYIEFYPEKSNKKLEYMEFIKNIEVDEEIVALTSLYIHLLDQLDWELLSREVVENSCEKLGEIICEKLQVENLTIEDKEYVKNDLVGNYIMILLKYIKEKWEE